MNFLAIPALLAWLAVQLAGLTIAALRLPLAAQYPGPAESHAVPVLLAVQFAWASMLFPRLCRTWQAALAALASGWVMLVLAGALAAWALPALLTCAACLGLWIAALSAWRLALRRSGRALMTAAAVASAWSIGGPLVRYFALETRNPIDAGPHLLYGPLWLVVAAPHDPPVAAAWLLLTILGAGIAAVLLARLRKPAPPAAG